MLTVTDDFVALHSTETKSDERHVLPLKSASSLSTFSQARDPVSTPHISPRSLFRHSLQTGCEPGRSHLKVSHLPHSTLHMSVATFLDILTCNITITTIVFTSSLCRVCACSALARHVSRDVQRAWLHQVCCYCYIHARYQYRYGIPCPGISSSRASATRLRFNIDPSCRGKSRSLEGGFSC
jgi:hypothetical protein